MSALADRLRQRIRHEGPITFYEWMNAALYDPEEGYYCRDDREKWGRAGDYRTSPERSPLYAATFARYFAHRYAALGSPTQWTIVESGAGGGHFAETVLQTLQDRSPDVFAATRCVIDEFSADARLRMKDRLARFGERVEFKSLADLGTLNPAVIFANELLDAFPVHRVIMRGDSLHEFYVDLNESGNFEWLIGEPSLAAKDNFTQLGIQLEDGQIAEVNPGIKKWIQLASGKLKRGYLIIVDYGSEASELYSASERPKGTLRAIHAHRLAENILARIGEQDLTTSIDWTLVKKLEQENGFAAIAFERQDKFLLKADLLEELEQRVLETHSEAEKLRLRTSAREMILPGGMGESFQVLVAEKK
jgi:SAM-dependent MidA family methyltransferase